MKKSILLIGTFLISILIFGAGISADSLFEEVSLLENAESFDRQLEVLGSIAAEYADELETGSWEIALTKSAAPGLPEDLASDDWESYSYSEVETFPEYMKGHKFIVLYCPGGGSASLAGDLMARFPEDMRADSMDAAEYAMILRWQLIESDYNYIPPATSYHRDYTAYIVNLKTGERTIFWTKRNSAKSSGQWGHLDGDLFSQEELWNQLRPQILPVITLQQKDGSSLSFISTGKNCFLYSYEGDVTDLLIPTEAEGHPVTGIEARFTGCRKLSRVIVEEGFKSLPEQLFNTDYRMVIIACCYLPSTLQGGLIESGLGNDTVIYAPEGSYAADVAVREGYEWVACSNPEEMPDVELVQEGNLTFRLYGDEAALLSCEGGEDSVTIPEKVKDLPVTSILSYSLYDKDQVNTVIIPGSVRYIAENAIYPDSGVSMDVYLLGAEVLLDDCSIQAPFSSSPLTLFAPEGSTAQAYAADYNSDSYYESLLFEVWGDEAGDDMEPDERSLLNAVEMAENLGLSASDFWMSCDQQEYGRFGQAAECDFGKPNIAAVLRLTQEQYDSISVLMGGPDNVARVFATIVNTQWDLAYAKAAAETVQSESYKPVSDGSCAIVVLAYNSDMVLVTLESSGSAHAALLCSSASITGSLTAAYVNSIAEQYGISAGCTVYGQDTMPDVQ